jgi:hypothetical protein
MLSLMRLARPETYQTSGTERGYEVIPTPSSCPPLDLTQTREEFDLDVPPPQILSGMVDEKDLYPHPRYMSHGHFSLIDAGSTSEIRSEKRRPAYRYATLIAVAISYSKPTTATYRLHKFISGSHIIFLSIVWHRVGGRIVLGTI